MRSPPSRTGPARRSRSRRTTVGLGLADRAIVGHFDRNLEHTVATIDDRAGSTLGARDMYDSKSQTFAPVREGYKKYIATMLEIAGFDDAAKRARSRVRARGEDRADHWTRVEQRDPVKKYNKMTVAELAKLAPGVDWKLWLATAGVRRRRPAFNVDQPSSVTGMVEARQERAARGVAGLPDAT